jgi:hypothetical protein
LAGSADTGLLLGTELALDVVQVGIAAHLHGLLPFLLAGEAMRLLRVGVTAVVVA